MEKKAKDGSWFPGGTAVDRLLFKYQFLLEDYHVLKKETLAKRRKFLRLRRKKLKLVPIVKFLRRKLKSFYESPSQTKQIELKNERPNDMQVCELPLLVKSLNPLEATLAAGNQQARESTNDGCSLPMVDLNLVPSQDVDEAMQPGVEPKVSWKDPVVSATYVLPLCGL
ncbi:hypothetical protein HPP92_002656 [Vanilla planifolia]|uniref:Uncharacterized protein n=1 Tax=Vanilla planifolia TaxID=51239 RepID=A0A835VJ57_VANPL|nr:hypothetical protein HPP92_002656 [Vanilla planifolia]